MNYSAEEVMQYVGETDVKFIRLAFCDVYGRQRNVSVMPGELERAFREGIAVDASAIPGFGGEVRSDLFLRPDPATLAELPWRSENGQVVRMFCAVTDSAGRPVESDSRELLRQAVEEARKEGYAFAFGAEMEFYLFKTDEQGRPTREPYDHAGYMDIAPEDKGENVRREICLTLERMGIRPEASHHEEGPGQNEIDFRYSDPLTAADNAVTFQAVVRTVAARNGLYADFSPKPLPDQPGSGLHINLSVESLRDRGDNMPPLNRVIAGILNRAVEMTAFLDPSEASYERLGGRKTPKYVSWSAANRSQLIRVPAVPAGRMPRAELRSPDAGANPYVAFALLIRAGLQGLLNQETPLEEADLNLGTAEVPGKYRRLPATLEEARRAAAESAFIKKNLPEALQRIYCGG